MMSVRTMAYRGLNKINKRVLGPHQDSLAWSLRHALTSLRVSHVLDVGAHHGEFVGQLRTGADYRGPVTSFECSPGALSVLRPQAAADPSWEVQPFALGAQSGEATFNDYDGGQLSSLNGLTDFAVREWNFAAPQLITVQVRRLDDVLPDLQGPVFLKIDTQGNDLAVLAGAQGVLPVVSAILMEMPVVALYEGTKPFEQHVSEVRELGFDPVGFWPVQRLSGAGISSDDLRVLEFDGMFVRREP